MIYTQLDALREQYSVVPFDTERKVEEIGLTISRRDALTMLPEPIADFIEMHLEDTQESLADLPLSWFSWIIRDKPGGPANLAAVKNIAEGGFSPPKGIPPRIAARARQQAVFMLDSYDNRTGLQGFTPSNEQFHIEPEDVVGFAQDPDELDTKSATETATKETGDIPPPPVPSSEPTKQPDTEKITVDIKPGDIPKDITFLKQLDKPARAEFWKFMADNNRLGLDLNGLKTVSEAELAPELARVWALFVESKPASQQFQLIQFQALTNNQTINFESQADQHAFDIVDSQVRIEAPVFIGEHADMGVPGFLYNVNLSLPKTNSRMKEFSDLPTLSGDLFQLWVRKQDGYVFGVSNSSGVRSDHIGDEQPVSGEVAGAALIKSHLQKSVTANGSGNVLVDIHFLNERLLFQYNVDEQGQTTLTQASNEPLVKTGIEQIEAKLTNFSTQFSSDPDNGGSKGPFGRLADNHPEMIGNPVQTAVLGLQESKLVQSALARCTSKSGLKNIIFNQIVEDFGQRVLDATDNSDATQHILLQASQQVDVLCQQLKPILD